MFLKFYNVSLQLQHKTEITCQMHIQCYEWQGYSHAYLANETRNLLICSHFRHVPTTTMYFTYMCQLHNLHTVSHLILVKTSSKLSIVSSLKIMKLQIRLIKQSHPKIQLEITRIRNPTEVCLISSILHCTIMMNHRLRSRNNTEMIHSALEKRWTVRWTLLWGKSTI